MKPLNFDYLKLWVNSWSKTYPVTYDALLDKLRGLPHFTIEQMAALVDWKYPPPLAGRRRVRHDKIRELLQSNTEQAVIDATAAAFAQTNDDRRALTMVMRLSGVGIAIGSTALMAHDPARFTVYDDRASKSLLALQYLTQQGSWVPYLCGCRAVATDTGYDLRTVDRALFMAKGRLTLPD